MPTISISKHASTALILASGMLISGKQLIYNVVSDDVYVFFAGVCNTILNKYQDMQCVDHCDDPDPKKRIYFEQPLWQT